MFTDISVAQLNLAPGKSMRTLENVPDLQFDREGMFGDREYMWVEAAEHVNTLYHPGETVEPGHFLSQREDLVLTSMIPHFINEGLHIRVEGGKDPLSVVRAEDVADNRIPVSVWGWNGEAVDQGDDAAQWGAERIGRPVRLVAVSNQAPRYVENNPVLGRIGFADGYPLLIISTASINELNSYLESINKPAIPTNRFRADIILDGLEARGEDEIDYLVVSGNGLYFMLKREKPCDRCPIPDTDQITGERKTYVRSALGKIGRVGTYQDKARFGDQQGTFFGQNFSIVMPRRGMGATDTMDLWVHQKIDRVVYANSPNWTPVHAI